VPTDTALGALPPIRSAAVSAPGASPSIMKSCPAADTGGAGGTTVNVRSPRFPSLVASIVTTPADMPVAIPDCVTVAIKGSRDVHAIARPVNTVPRASSVVAVSCWVSPAKMVGFGDVT
jgi:hypothetical protein